MLVWCARIPTMVFFSFVSFVRSLKKTCLFFSAGEESTCSYAVVVASETLVCLCMSVDGWLDVDGCGWMDGWMGLMDIREMLDARWCSGVGKGSNHITNRNNNNSNKNNASTKKNTEARYKYTHTHTLRGQSNMQETREYITNYYLETQEYAKTHCRWQ